MVIKAKSESSPQGRRERKRLDTRDRLLHAALELFAKQGFADTKVEHITERADVAKGTFFNYFKSKEHLIGELSALQVGKVDHALAEIRTSKASFEVRMRALAKELIALPSSTPELARSLMCAFLGADDVREILRLQIMGRGRETLAQIIEHAQKSGEVRSDLKAADIARNFQQSMFGMLLLWSVNPKGSITDSLDSMLDMFWSGIRAPRKSGRTKE